MKNKFFILAAIALPLMFTNCSNGGDDNNKQPGPGPGPIRVLNIFQFTDVKFATVMDESHDSARFFSTSRDQSIKVADVTDENAPAIDLGFAWSNDVDNGVYIFVSPDNAEKGIGNAGATKTEYMMDRMSVIISDEEFDALTENSDFDKFEFVPDSRRESFPSFYDVPFYCFFKNAAGKMGVIKIKEIIADGEGPDPAITVDIKMQK